MIHTKNNMFLVLNAFEYYEDKFVPYIISLSMAWSESPLPWLPSTIHFKLDLCLKTLIGISFPWRILATISMYTD